MHGLLLVDKPKNLTSHDVVARARKILRIPEVGHTGTLDPLASGLMVLLIGEATKISEYILNFDKTYQVKVKFGLRTDTLDVQGKVLTSEDVSLDSESIINSAKELQGTMNWEVPIFSAAKTGGKKLYEMARNNEEVNPPIKEMKFWGLETIEVGSNTLTANISCSKGSFIRSWAANLGDKLGVGGAVEELRRLNSGAFDIVSAIDLERLAQLASSSGLSSLGAETFIPLNLALPALRGVTVSGRDERLIHNGQVSYDLARRLIVEVKEATRAQKTIGIKIYSGNSGHLLSILEAKPGKGLKIRRVFKMLAAEP